MIRKILIGIDDSKFAEHATEYGFELAHKFNAEVGLVNIVEPIVLPQTTAGLDPLGAISSTGIGSGVEDLELIDIQNTQSQNIIARVIEKYQNEELVISHFNEYGSTADGILNCSKEYGADLIVIGTHNRSGLDRFLMGSVAEHVVRHSEVPVLVVPMKAE